MSADPRVSSQLTALATQTAAMKHTISTQMIAVKERLTIARESLIAAVGNTSNPGPIHLEGTMILMSVYAPIEQLKALSDSIKAATVASVSGVDITKELDEIGAEFAKIYATLGDIMKQINSKVYFGALSDADVERITREVTAKSEVAAQDFVMRAMSMIMTKPSI